MNAIDVLSRGGEKRSFVRSSWRIARITLGSRREDLNTPSADYESTALTLSYTGIENSKENIKLRSPLCGHGALLT